MQTAAFTPLFEWVMDSDKDLTMLEGLIIGEVYRFGANGCHETSATLAKKFHVHRSSVIRAIKKLIRKEWIAAVWPVRDQRILFINSEKLTAGPLFAEKKSQEETHKETHKETNRSATGGRTVRQGCSTVQQSGSTVLHNYR